VAMTHAPISPGDAGGSQTAADETQDVVMGDSSVGQFAANDPVGGTGTSGSQIAAGDGARPLVPRIPDAYLLQAISSNKPVSVTVVDQDAGGHISEEQRSFLMECQAAQDAHDARECACQEAANIFWTVIAGKENPLSGIGLPPRPRKMAPMPETVGRITSPTKA
jgi:hypothetical protein